MIEDGTGAFPPSEEDLPVPPDQDALGLVAAILKDLAVSIALIRGNAERLRVLLVERDAATIAALEAAEATMVKSYRGGLDSSGFGPEGAVALVRAALARVKEAS